MFIQFERRADFTLVKYNSWSLHTLCRSNYLKATKQVRLDMMFQYLESSLQFLAWYGFC